MKEASDGFREVFDEDKFAAVNFDQFFANIILAKARDRERIALMSKLFSAIKSGKLSTDEATLKDTHFATVVTTDDEVDKWRCMGEDEESEEDEDDKLAMKPLSAVIKFKETGSLFSDIAATVAPIKLQNRRESVCLLINEVDRKQITIAFLTFDS